MSNLSSLKTLASQIEKSFEDDKSGHFAAKGALSALCNSFMWNINNKDERIRGLQAECKDLLDATHVPTDPGEMAVTSAKTPVSEIIVAKLERKYQFFEQLESQKSIYVSLLEEAKAAYRKLTGETWVPPRKGASARPSAAGIEEMKKRMGLS